MTRNAKETFQQAMGVAATSGGLIFVGGGVYMISLRLNVIRAAVEHLVPCSHVTRLSLVDVAPRR